MAREVAKKVKNAILYTDGTIRIDEVRLSYPALARPKVETDDKGEKKGESYSATGLMPKATHRAAKDLIKEAIEKLLTENKVKALPSDRKFLRDGDQTGKEENEGMFMVVAREKKRPSCRGRNKQPLEREEIDEVLYGGCWVNMLIRPWFQNNSYGKRVNANLIAVQFVRDDKAFGEGRISEDDIDDTFEDMEDDDDDSGFEDDDEL